MHKSNTQAREASEGKIDKQYHQNAIPAIRMKALQIRSLIRII